LVELPTGTIAKSPLGSGGPGTAAERREDRGAIIGCLVVTGLVMALLVAVVLVLWYVVLRSHHAGGGASLSDQRYLDSLIAIPSRTDVQGPISGTFLGNGAFTGTIDWAAIAPCGAGPGAPTVATATSVDPHGAELHETIYGAACRAAPLEVDVKGLYTVTGGTGCFRGARGQGQVTSYMGFLIPPTKYGEFGVFNKTGAITLKGDSHCLQSDRDAANASP
jgi:hypothetical protein